MQETRAITGYSSLGTWDLKSTPGIQNTGNSKGYYNVEVMEKLSPNAEQVIRGRYLLKNAGGKPVETPEQLFRRVAVSIASAEEQEPATWANRFYEVMAQLEFLPNSPTLMNAGLEKGQLSACFVLPVKDSLRDIFESLKNTALIHQSGGGTGFNFSQLRPRNDRVTASGGSSSGPVGFMKIFDTATEQVKQGGKRRGANMGILDITHPDIEEFLTAKQEDGVLRNFNLSAGISDAFMMAVENDRDWELINPRTNEVTKVVRAKYLWSLFTEQAWKSGDPGLIFLDTINSQNPIPAAGLIKGTNPCGEVPLLEYESCNLGSINLSRMLRMDKGSTEVDWARLSHTVRTGIRFLDNIISVNFYLLPEIEEIAIKHRKIGLGVMGWAEMLIQLGIPYASEKAFLLGEKIMNFIMKESYKASSHLAAEKGPFPAWEHSRHYPHTPLRNATCNSIAPTGTLSVLADTSYSIEPLFAPVFERVGILDGKNQREINRFLIEQLKATGLWSEALREQIFIEGSIKNIAGIPPKIKLLFKSSLEIPWKHHLYHQRAFQKYTDNAVSKTINLPASTSKEEIGRIYCTAWKYNLKGITIYRYGTKADQVLQCRLNTNREC